MQLATVQAFLLFGLMPLTVMNFSRVSFAAPAVNLIAVPLFSIVTVPFALAGVLLDGPAAAAGDVALRIAGVGIEVLHWLVDAGLSFPHAAQTTSATGAVAGICMASVLAWVVLPRAWPGRHVTLLGALALVSARVPGPPTWTTNLEDFMTANRSWMIVTMIVIVATVSGCSSELPEMEMIDNNQALQYVTVCQYGLAMAKVDKMIDIARNDPEGGGVVAVRLPKATGRHTGGEGRS